METEARPVTYQSNPFELLRPAYRGVLSNLGTYILSFVVGFAAIVAVGLVAVFAFAAAHSAGTAGEAFVGLLVAAVVIAGLIYVTPVPTKLALAMARQQPISVGALFKHPWELSLRVFWTQLLAGLAIVGGFLLLIVPGIIFMVWFIWSQYVAVDEGLGGIAALRRSRDLTRNRFVDVFGTIGLPGLFGLLIVIPVLGWLAYTVITFLIFPLGAVRYLQLKALKAHSDGKDVRTSGLNYLAIAGSVLYFLVSAGLNAYNAQHLRPTDHPGNHVNPYYMEPK